MQFSSEKGLEKRILIHHSCQLIRVDGLCCKMGKSIYQFYKKIFCLSKNVYHAMEKNRAEIRLKEWVITWL